MVLKMSQKTIVVTGCNRGVGEGIAKLFLSKNHTVIGVNRTPSSIKSENYKEIILDVSNSENFESIENNVKKISNRIDLLVVNSAIRRFDTVENMSIDDFEESINVNLKGAFLVTKYLTPMIKDSQGDITYIGSHSEKYTFEKGAAYCSSKNGMRSLAECVMHELRYDNVRVSYLSLGAIKNRDHGYDESWKLTPNDVAETVSSLFELPKNVLVSYLDVRPIKPLKSDISGLDRLQYL